MKNFIFIAITLITMLSCSSKNYTLYDAYDNVGSLKRLEEHTREFFGVNKLDLLNDISVTYINGDFSKFNV